MVIESNQSIDVKKRKQKKKKKKKIEPSFSCLVIEPWNLTA